MEEKHNVHINGKFNVYTECLACNCSASFVLTRVLGVSGGFIPLHWTGVNTEVVRKRTSLGGQARLPPALNPCILLPVAQVAGACRSRAPPLPLGNVRVHLPVLHWQGAEV